MKFLYSDTQDYVDPAYDFLNDRSRPGRERYWSDVYAHEFMDPAPYDGLLVSMSAVRQAAGVATSKVRYSTREEQRLLRDGARRFLRYGGPRFKDAMLLGDCGAFAYVELVSGERLIKRVHRQPGGWNLESLNAAHPPRFVQEAEVGIIHKIMYGRSL